MNKKKRKIKTKKEKRAFILELILGLLLAPIVGGMIFLSPVIFLLIDQYILVPNEAISVSVVKDIEQYEEDRLDVGNAANNMPSLESLSDYTNLQYAHKERIDSFAIGFVSDGLSLFASYDEGMYETKKEEVLTSYTFLEEPIQDLSGDYVMPVTEFTYKGYDMSIVPDEEYLDFRVCKSFMLVGYNDELHTVSYMYFYDSDLDYIAAEEDDPLEEMIVFVEDYFYWYDM